MKTILCCVMILFATMLLSIQLYASNFYHSNMVASPPVDSLALPSTEDTPAMIQLLSATHKMPQFRGGSLSDFKDWVQRNLRYPSEVLRRGVFGRVVVSFVVEPTGRVSEVEAHESPDSLLSVAAMRVVQNSPKWKPASRDGVPVRIRFFVPVDFDLATNPAQHPHNASSARDMWRR